MALPCGAFSTARFAGDLELPQFAIAQDARFVDAALGGDARALDFLAGGDLGFLQRLRAGDLELLDRAPALEPGDVERLLAHHVGAARPAGAATMSASFTRAVGVGALDQLGGDLDRAILLGDLHDLARSTSSTSRVFDECDALASRAPARSRCARPRSPRAA